MSIRFRFWFLIGRKLEECGDYRRGLWRRSIFWTSLEFRCCCTWVLVYCYWSFWCLLCYSFIPVIILEEDSSDRDRQFIFSQCKLFILNFLSFCYIGKRLKDICSCLFFTIITKIIQAQVLDARMLNIPSVREYLYNNKSCCFVCF